MSQNESAALDPSWTRVVARSVKATAISVCVTSVFFCSSREPCGIVFAVSVTVPDPWHTCPRDCLYPPNRAERAHEGPERRGRSAPVRRRRMSPPTVHAQGAEPRAASAQCLAVLAGAAPTDPQHAVVAQVSVPRARDAPPACPRMCCLDTLPHASQSPLWKAARDVDGVSLGATLRRSAGPGVP